MSTDDVGEQSMMTPGLRYSPASPFVRKVVVFAHETGLADRIELVPTDVWAPDSNIFRDNPLGKVPALVSDDGTFIGSALCCDDLETLHGGSRLIPAVPPRALVGAATGCAGRRHHGSRRGSGSQSE
jgi:glutathione S-transferase